MLKSIGLLLFILLTIKGYELLQVYNRTVVLPKYVVSFLDNGGIVGTGFYLKYDSKYYILTNKHICDIYRQVNVYYYPKSGEYKIVKKVPTINDKKVVEILQIYKKHDLCLLTSDKKIGLELANGTFLREPVTIYGHPRGMNLTIRDGNLIQYTAIRAPWIGFGMYSSLFLSTIGYGGNSGSPVIDMWGNVIGVVFAVDRNFHTEMHAVPVQVIRRFLKEYHEQNNIKQTGSTSP